MKNSTKILVQIGVLISTLATITVNALANALPINNMNTGTISDNIPNLFAPAGLTFIIWGVIYILMLGFAIYYVRDWVLKNVEKDIDIQLGLAFIIGNLANFVWIFLWHYLLIEWSLLMMLILLGSLIYMNERLFKQKNELTQGEKIAYSLTVSVYLGWITVATVANVTAVLVEIGWNRWNISEAVWTIIILIIATGITAAMIWFRKNLAHAAVVIWAFIGIIVKRVDPINEPHPEIVITTSIMIGILVLLAILQLLLKDKNKQEK